MEARSGMLIFKALHIMSMFTAVTLLTSVPVFVALAIWHRDVRGLASVYRLARHPGNTVVGSFFLLAGVAFGLLTAATGGYDFLAGWLIAAYVMVAALILANVLPAKRRVRQVAEEAVEAEAGRRPVDEVVRDMANAPIWVFGIDVALFVAIIADMVLKPF
jgi:protein-S-isoprenylcysteine O-methyltransferase Ste14